MPKKLTDKETLLWALATASDNTDSQQRQDECWMLSQILEIRTDAEVEALTKERDNARN
jgi:hypothetical protein